MIGGPDWLDFYQLEQVKETEFLLKIIANDAYQQGDEVYFVERLTETFNTNLKVDVSIVDYIASERSGKYQFVRGLHNNV